MWIRLAQHLCGGTWGIFCDCLLYTSRGVGCKYFSQDAVNRLAPRAGIELPEDATPAEKLKIVQGLMNEGDKRAVPVYETIGCYLAHAIAYYSKFYDIRHILLLGRVMSGKGRCV